MQAMGWAAGNISASGKLQMTDVKFSLLHRDGETTLSYCRADFVLSLELMGHEFLGASLS